VQQKLVGRIELVVVPIRVVEQGPAVPSLHKTQQPLANGLLLFALGVVHTPRSGAQVCA
jgi:hypothetical protein